MTKDEALDLALEALKKLYGVLTIEEIEPVDKAITAIKQARALDKKAENARELGLDYEPVTILPDGSAFGVMSFPLPDDHWLYAPNEYRDGEYEPIDLPKPILTHALREAVVAAVRYAVRGATMRGKETDFDPDALVQNAVYALCGPYTTPPAQPAPVQEPVAFNAGVPPLYPEMKDGETISVEYTTPPAAQRQWVGLTDEEVGDLSDFAYANDEEFVRNVEAKLKEKNT
jgi:hypothetical protein